MRRHISYANVMATIAVFFALAGGSYAAIQIPKNSVGSKQLKKSAVTSRAIKNNTITGADVDEAKLGTVPVATRAVSAGSAATAANADTLDGLDSSQLKLRCAGGTIPKWGACLEAAAHNPTTPLRALEDCSSRGGTLPSYVQLTWVRTQPSIQWAQGEGFNQYEMTGDAFNPAVGKQSFIAIDQGGNFFEVLPTTDTVRYRCLLAPVNG
jgi:hypothetical protein